MHNAEINVKREKDHLFPDFSKKRHGKRDYPPFPMYILDTHLRIEMK